MNNAKQNEQQQPKASVLDRIRAATKTPQMPVHELKKGEKKP